MTSCFPYIFSFFFFNDTATTEIYTLSLHDALPIFSAVEVKDVDLPPEMKRAIARQAEAERERRAKVINAEGELQASEKLAQAAHIIGSEPAAIQLRYLQTVTEISSENNSTTFFPIPIDMFKVFLEAVARKPATPALPERTAGETLPAAPQKRKLKA